MNKNIEGLKATENTIYMRYTVHIDDQIINNVKECIKKFEVLPMEDKIPLSRYCNQNMQEKYKIL
ncbi:hypothetical protein ABFV71_09160 [Staphylococcus saprophyticus]